MAQLIPSFWSPEHAAALKTLARKAGDVIQQHTFVPLAVERKSDESPVTAADRESQRVILEGLALLTPGIPVIAEEKANLPPRAAGGTFWLVDPLDGTRDFITGGRMEYAVNIGLIVDGKPCLGVVYAPALDELFYGEPGRMEWHTAKGTKTFEQGSIAVSSQPPRLLTSRHEVSRLPLQAWQDTGKIAGWRPCTGASFKSGLLAAGEGELYPRIGPTCEWDTAAGEALLRAVGGCVVTLDGKPLAYGKSGYRNGYFLAAGPSFDPAHLPDFLAMLNKNGKR